jgi:hypothetical protein
LKEILRLSEDRLLVEIGLKADKEWTEKKLEMKLNEE